ncbi:MAG: hypothetical protein AB7K24_11315 [Gemmataceae bacterium]
MRNLFPTGRQVFFYSAGLCVCLASGAMGVPLPEKAIPQNAEVLHSEKSTLGTIKVKRWPAWVRVEHFGATERFEYQLIYEGTLHDVQFRHSVRFEVACLLPPLSPDIPLATACKLKLGRDVFLVPGRLEPAGYYTRVGPLGRIFEALRPAKDEHVACIGLGAGTTACYARAGQTFTYYEADPALVNVTRKWFTYLRDCQGKTEIVVGAPRTKLAEAADKKFRLIIVNPVGAEFTPVNLLTREAVQLYFRKLTDNGVVALHISHRHLNQAPVLGNIAKDQGLVAAHIVHSPDDLEDPIQLFSEWVVLARKKEHLAPLLKGKECQVLHADPKFPLWTDKFADTKAVRKEESKD